jgi:hypothetical protein
MVRYLHRTPWTPLPTAVYRHEETIYIRPINLQKATVSLGNTGWYPFLKTLIYLALNLLQLVRAVLKIGESVLRNLPAVPEVTCRL